MGSEIPLDRRPLFANRSEPPNGSFVSVLLDDQMPRLRGGEVSQRIRAMVGDKRNIPILGATASIGEL